ncbi:gliding motility-associated C-terminal domain-containing protein [Empedobacter stercoris]|uniref:T9SS type B sorting domain-containing protein n=1 Tax=Empedobacter stercoris TaxID=1628248 RepID=UPI0016622E5F|nr:T9SS type B sorting domain-containing protein [Empedobacter stercoris]MCA4808339.1 gliding motility-associated C-terminal domain-containing protein [Empedobacter stercoris]QNT14477.1 T9SS type B sorting domain-containing protein [Empedobacter stercoris]
MKKIFYFLLLMISGFVWGQQHPLTRIDPNQLNFLNIPLTPKSVDFKTTIGCGGRNDGRSHAAMLYFKADYDLDLKFDIIGQLDGDYAVIVYKVNDTNGDGIPNEVFQTNTTITALRSIYSSHSTKSLVDNSTDFCEFYGSYGTSDGKVKSLDFEANSYIVIAIQANLAAGTNPLFDIHLNIAKTVDNLVFDKHCYTDDYLLSDVKTKIINDIRASDPSVNVGSVEFYKPNNTLTNDNISYANGIEQTLYARVYDNLGKLVYIYKPIIFKFIPEHQFNFKPTFETEYACTPTYTIPDEDELLNKLFPTVDSNYSISSIVIDGTSYTSGQNVNLAVGQTTSMKIKVHYGGGCPIDSHEVSIPLKQGSPVLSSIEPETTCKDEYRINFDNIYTKLNIDKNQYDLIVTLGGITILDGESTPITTTSPLNYQVKIKSRTGGGCESDEVDFVVTKTSPANILPAEIKDICFADFDQSYIDNAISIIQNGNSYNLKFYQEDGLTEITDLLTFIKTTKNGKIIVKSLAVDNGNTICDTTKELTFKLDKSSFDKVDNIPTLNSSCSEVGLGHIFTVLEIEDYLKNYFGRTDIVFNGIVDEILPDNGSKTITFQVKINGEPCWSEEMTLKLQVITKPNVREAISELQADCDDKITIDAQVLSDLFGANSIVDYHYEILHNNSTPLIFVGGKATIKVRFKNKLDNSCFVEKEIIINKKPDLIVDETYTFTNEIVYCEDDDINAKSQIKAILDYIKSQYPTLVSKSSVDEIYNQFNSEEGFVNINFDDPNYCGTVAVKFFYKKNALPNFEIPTSDQICSDSKFEIDFEELAKAQSLDITDYVFLVTGDDVTKVSAYKYELGIGDYSIIISNSNSGCPKVFTLKLTNSETPIINKITINEKSVIVSAKGNGKLEYALFDSLGKVILDWQTKNELIIPDNIKNNNFTVRVRLNNCGVFERKDVIYLVLPNVVTPNQDGKNDVWKPMTKNGKINDVSNSYKLIIFDRYGKQILSKEGTNIIEWDGTHNGKPVADGTYWYMLESNEELQVLYSGYIVVKRKIN